MRLTHPALKRLPPLLALTLSISLLVPGSVRGQISLSVQAGASLATWANDVLGVVAYRTGVKVGASAILPVTANLRLQLGAAYAQKGYVNDGLAIVDPEGGRVAEFSIEYVEIPLLLRRDLTAEGILSPHFSVGPALAFPVNCSTGLRGYGTRACSSTYSKLKKMDFGAMTGVGVDIAISGSSSVSLDVLSYFGLSAIYDNGIGQNRALSILAGITFPVG